VRLAFFADFEMSGTFYLSVAIFGGYMDDFTQFDAFARAIAVHLNRGVFAKDPVLTTELRKTLLSVYSNFGEGFDRDGNREFAQFDRKRIGGRNPSPIDLCS
jgi:hypothetical protein